MSKLTDKELTTFLEENKKSKELHLLSKGITNYQTKIIGQFLEENSAVETLNLEDNYIENQGVIHVANLLEINRCLKSLFLANNNIKDDEIEYLVKALKTNNSLTAISLSSNYIADKALEFLREALKVNKTLAFLNLSVNYIGDKGVEHLSEALKINSGVEELNLNNNEFGDVGADYLASVLETNYTLVKLRLCDNSITNLGIDKFIASLSKNKIVTHIDVAEVETVDEEFGPRATYDNEERLEKLLVRNKAYVKSFSAYWKANQNKEIKLNLGDTKYFLGCDKGLLKQNLEGTPDLAWNKGQIMKFWQDNAFVILGICKDVKSQLMLPAEITSHIFSFLSPYDFATKDFIASSADSSGQQSFVEEVKDIEVTGDN